MVLYILNAFKDPIGETIDYDDHLKIFTGGGCNSIVLSAEEEDKVLIVDTKYLKGAKHLRKAITASDITIVNTHFHMDHARGNKLYPEAFVISGICSWKHWDFDTGRSKRPDKILQPGEKFSIQFGKEVAHVINVGNAHTATDCIVYLEKRKVLVAGDLVWVNIHPMVLDSNCHIANWLKALDTIDTSYEIETLIPGHGAIANKPALNAMRDYFLSIQGALHDPAKLRMIRNKYKAYKPIPITNSISNTVKKIRKEFK